MASEELPKDLIKYCEPFWLVQSIPSNHIMGINFIFVCILWLAIEEHMSSTSYMHSDAILIYTFVKPSYKIIIQYLDMHEFMHA